MPREDRDKSEGQSMYFGEFLILLSVSLSALDPTCSFQPFKPSSGTSGLPLCRFTLSERVRMGKYQTEGRRDFCVTLDTVNSPPAVVKELCPVCIIAH
jgi:hypothetical protein